MAWKRGRVDSLEDVHGLQEWRFVPVDWTSPLPHTMWCEVKDPATISEWITKLYNIGKMTWWLNGPNGVYPYSADVSYDAEKRPVLVLVGGFR